MNMNWKSLSLFLLCLMVGSLIAGQIQQVQPKRPVKRAERPKFQKNDWEGIFFEDIFSEGFQGQRPSRTDIAVAQNSNAPTTDPEVRDAAGSWSELIAADTLENEVKRWQQELALQVTTPIKFKTTHSQIGETYSVLAMLFAIIGQYEGEVRWKEAAKSARVAFVDAASKSRGTDIAAYNSVKQRTEDLSELVRGGKFPDEPNADKPIDDWSSIIDRNPIMNRLELAVSDELKTPTSSEKEFKANMELVQHEAGLIAAMGRVLQSPEMLDADDEDYKAYAQQMVSAAMDMRSAAAAGDLEQVNLHLNRINQSCSECHGDWR